MRKKIVGILFVAVICSFSLASTGFFDCAAAKSPPKATKAVASDQIKAAQTALNTKGFDLKVDGMMGKQTRIALKKFQKKNGLRMTGKPDQATLTKLGIL